MSNAFTGVKVFSATMVAVREQLGEQVTSWLNARKGEIDVVEIMVRQSSDDAFHCVAIIVFYTHRNVLKATTRSDNGLVLEQTFKRVDENTISPVSAEIKKAATHASEKPRRLNFKRND